MDEGAMKKREAEGKPVPICLVAALCYAARGWRVLPLHNPDSLGQCSCANPTCDRVGEHPRTPNGVKSATTDFATIRSWWNQWPDANVGIATGDTDAPKRPPGAAVWAYRQLTAMQTLGGAQTKRDYMDMLNHAHRLSRDPGHPLSRVPIEYWETLHFLIREMP